MARVLVLDTETTGFSPQWDRIVEFAAVEVEPRTGVTGAIFHHVINPLRPIPPVVTKIHGLHDTDVRDKPTFANLAPKMADFLRGSVLAIQNAGFDVPMLNAEFGRSGTPSLDDLRVTIIDTLDVSRNVFPLVAKHDLDSICDHLGVNRLERTTHGALLDVKLLAATLPKFATAYDAWRADSEPECGIEVVRFEQELARCAEQLVSADHTSAEAIDRSASRLAAADRCISATEKWLDAALAILINSGENWSCKHLSARWAASESTSWKGVATANLSADDLAKYQVEAVTRTYTPTPDAPTADGLMVVDRMLDRVVVSSSISCLIRGLLALHAAGKRVGDLRAALRETLLTYVDAGYTIQHGTLHAGQRKSTDYKQAVEDLCPDADTTAHESQRVSLKVGARNAAACEALFAEA